MIFALTRAGTPQSEIAPCIANWDTLTWEEREQCAESIGGIALAEETVMAVAQQTADARPTQSLESIRATEHAMWVEAGRPTPVPTPVPGIVPQGWEVTEPYRSPTERLAPDPLLRGMNSAWWVGVIIADNGSPYRLLATTHREYCDLFINPIGLERIAPQATEAWDCPEDRGQITITGVTGPADIITLTDTLSRTITFDLATEEWTLEGEPWLPAATPTP
jgi:hypothetical protein